ncbi:MAG: autotransporter-associated beta strand repeat-containing protein [Verrucomicrobiales bacterium]|nr:autotransporter-associated beta strand repeat-containing protein [Verrucomicrobiales bacterium]
MNPSKTSCRFLLAAALPICFLAPHAFAINGVTKANNSDNLNLGSSWTGGTAPDGTDSNAGAAVFDTSIIGTSAATYTLGGDVTWGMVRVDRDAPTSGSLITITGANTITLNGNTTVGGSSRADAILLNSGVGSPLEIDSNIKLGGTVGGTEFFTASRNLTLDGNVDLNGVNLNAFTAGGTSKYNGILSNSSPLVASSLTKSGNGELILANSNTYNGTTTFNGGIVRAANSDTVFSTSAITVTSNTTLATADGGGARNIGNGVTVNAARVLTLDGGFADLTLSGNIDGGGGLTKASIGNVILSGTNSYTGATTINSAAGGLQISGATNTGAGNVTILGVGGLTIRTGGSLTTTGVLARGSAVGGNLVVENGGMLNVGTANISWNTSTFKVDGTMNVGTGGLNITTNATTTISGSGAIAADVFTTGNANTTVNFTNTGSMTLFTRMSVGGALGNNPGTLVVNQSAGTINTPTLKLGEDTSEGPRSDMGSRTFNLTGGRINIGSGGIIAGTGAAGKAVNLGVGTVGATSHWGSILNMALTDAGTGTTFDTLDAVDGLTPRKIGLSGNLTGAGSLVKTGAGTLVLSGAANSYAGTTTVNGGTLLVSGTNTGLGLVTVGSGGTLGGSGSLAANLSVSGILAPGESIESLGVGSVTFNNNSTFAYELDSSVSNTGDLLDSTGSLDLNGTVILTLTDIPGGILVPGSKLTLINYAGAWNNGTFTYNGGPLADDATFVLGANQWQFNYNDTSGGGNFAPDQAGATSFVTMTVVPEPGATTLLAGLAALFLMRRRRA